MLPAYYLLFNKPKTTHFNVFAVDHVERDGVEDERVEDLAQDLAVFDPLVKVLLWHLLEEVGDPVEGFVLQLDVALKSFDALWRRKIKVLRSTNRTTFWASLLCSFFVGYWSWAWSSLVEGGEQPDRPNSKHLWNVAMHVHHSIFGFVKNTSTYQLAQYSRFTKELHHDLADTDESCLWSNALGCSAT